MKKVTIFGIFYLFTAASNRKKEINICNNSIINKLFLSISIISGSRNCSILAISGSRNCTISTISRSRLFFVHFYNFWIQKLQYFGSFWVQKLHHFYNFWGPYRSWGDICLAPAGGPMDRRARLNLT